MNKTTEQLLSQLNTMQSEHIKILNERIEVLQQTIEIDKQTIKIQSETINNYLKSKSNV
jgi:tRNA A37 threonylcarbamoyladenosine dehydratase